MKILITGFDPFNKETINPAYEAVKRLPRVVKDNEVIKVRIPTSFNRSIEVLDELIDTHHPDVVICVGQAGGRSQISLERIAVNMRDARIPDNDGYQPQEVVIDSEGQNAYFSTLPLQAMNKTLLDAGIPCNISNTAGLYVCNNIMYHLLNRIEKEELEMIGGFIHVPYIPSQVIDKNNVASMSLDMIVEGLEHTLEVL